MGKSLTKMVFIDRKKKFEAKCAWCGKVVELFGWIRDGEANKEGLACEGCIKAKFFSQVSGAEHANVRI